MYKEPIETLGCPCPPPAAVLPSNVIGYRLVKNIPATEHDFKSHAALGKIKPKDLDDCSWSSCSLFQTDTKLINYNGLPKIKGARGIVRVVLDSTSGPIRASNSGHIDWWRLRTYPVTQMCTVAKVFP